MSGILVYIQTTETHCTPNTEWLTLHLFASVGASRIVWEFESSHSAQVAIQALNYVTFAELQNHMARGRQLPNQAP